jgi:hypothetical protein
MLIKANEFSFWDPLTISKVKRKIWAITNEEIPEFKIKNIMKTNLNMSYRKGTCIYNKADIPSLKEAQSKHRNLLV